MVYTCHGKKSPKFYGEVGQERTRITSLLRAFQFPLRIPTEIIIIFFPTEIINGSSHHFLINLSQYYFKNQFFTIITSGLLWIVVKDVKTIVVYDVD